MSGQFERVSALGRLKLTVLALSLLAVVSTLYLYDDMQYGVSSVLSDSRVFRMLKKKKKNKSGRKKKRKEKKIKNRPTKAPLRENNFMWLLGFPGSGTKEVLGMIEYGADRSMGTNYGKELLFPGDKRYKNGPFRNHKDLTDNGEHDHYEVYGRDFPMNVLVETHCTGFCIGDSCNHKSYMRNLLGKASKFNNACTKGTTINKKGKTVQTRGFTKESNIKDVLILVRNPVTMVGARMANEKGVKAMDVTHGDFIDYCADIDNKYMNSKEIKQLMKKEPSINDAAKGVPCYTEFLRIAIWYKNVFALASDRRTKVVLRWENVLAHPEHWLTEVTRKLSIADWSYDYRSYDGDFDADGLLISLTEPEEYEKIMNYIKVIVEPSEWEELYEVYADIHPGAWPRPLKDFLHIKNFKSDGYYSKVIDGITAEKCKEECQAYNGCHSFDFNNDKGQCMLESGNPKYEDLQFNDENIDHYAGVVIHENMHLDPNTIEDDDDDDDDDYGYYNYGYDRYNNYNDEYSYTKVSNETKLEQKVEEYEGTVMECQMQCYMLSWCSTFDYHKNERKCSLRGMNARRSKLTSNSGTQDHYAIKIEYGHKYSYAPSGVNRCEDVGKKTISSDIDCAMAIDEKTNRRCGRYGCDKIDIFVTSEADIPYGCLAMEHALNTNIDATGVTRHEWSLLCREGPY